MRLLTLIFLICSTTALADIYHRGYTNSHGTYVQPHYQTAPNNSLLDNYSTRGNTNPYTGREGTVDPYRYNGGSRGLSSDE